MAEHATTTWRRWVIGSVLVALVVLAVLAARGLYNHYVPEHGRRLLDAMRNDPIVAFRASGTELQQQRDRPGRVDWFGGGYELPWLRQTFAMTGEPGQTVDAYREAAQSAGWTFLAEGCSRAQRATGAVFRKSHPDVPVTLRVSAQLPGAVDEAADGDTSTGVLKVSLEAEHVEEPRVPVDAGLHRNNLHCLRDLDPSDPDLRTPELPQMTSQDICSLVPVTAATSVTPDIVGVEGVTNRVECWWVNPSGYPLFTVTPADQPRAHYEDRRLSVPGTSDELFYFSVYGMGDPDLAEAVWVATPHGPFQVEAGGALHGAQTSEDDPLLAFSRLVADRE